MNVYEEDRDRKGFWSLGDTVVELRSCRHIIPKRMTLKFGGDKRRKYNLSMEEFCINDMVEMPRMMRIMPAFSFFFSKT